MRNSASSSQRWPGWLFWGGWSKPWGQGHDTRGEELPKDDSGGKRAQSDDLHPEEDQGKLFSTRGGVIHTEHLVKQLHRQLESSRSSRHNTTSLWKFPKGARYKNLATSPKTTIYLGFYIIEGSGFSNSTHGLLGQFLHRSASTLKMTWGKSLVLQAILEVDDDPDRTASAILTKREQAGLNTTRNCWLLQHGALNVIDGSFPDYLVPHIRYNGLRELPPPAPL